MTNPTLSLSLTLTPEELRFLQQLLGHHLVPPSSPSHPAATVFSKVVMLARQHGLYSHEPLPLRLSAPDPSDLYKGRIVLRVEDD